MASRDCSGTIMGLLWLHVTAMNIIWDCHMKRLGFVVMGTYMGLPLLYHAYMGLPWDYHEATALPWYCHGMPWDYYDFMGLPWYGHETGIGLLQVCNASNVLRWDSHATAMALWNYYSFMGTDMGLPWDTMALMWRSTVMARQWLNGTTMGLQCDCHTGVPLRLHRHDNDIKRNGLIALPRDCHAYAIELP